MPRVPPQGESIVSSRWEPVKVGGGENYTWESGGKKIKVGFNGGKVVRKQADGM